MLGKQSSYKDYKIILNMILIYAYVKLKEVLSLSKNDKN